MGLNFGNAFQLNDDLADFFDQLNSGKEKFKDLNEGKMTYPIIITMSRVDKDSKNNISKLIKEKKCICGNNLDENAIQKIKEE